MSDPTSLQLFLGVIEPIAVAYAVASGIAFGATVILWISLRYPPKVPMSNRVAIGLTVLAAVTAGTLFFAGQIVQAYTTGDPFWPRALGRAVLWEVFSLSIGLGLGVARSFAHSAREIR